VRIPVSNDFSNLNPIIKPKTISAVTQDECPLTERAMDVMDCVIRAIQKEGILVIFNNHCSWPAWVGGIGNSMQGLWHYEFNDERKTNYSIESWIKSMEILVRRYNMSGFDIRNELHDEGGIRITWGESDDVHSDWLAASTLAAQRLHAIDDSILIIVGGLCWNFDLRAMMKNVGPPGVFERRKLVYTVHGYSYSFWWNINDDTLGMLSAASLLGGLVGLLCGFTCYYNYFSNFKSYYKHSTTCIPQGFDIYEFLAASMWFHGAWLATAYAYQRVSIDSGCSSVASGADWLVITSTVLTILAAVVFVMNYDYFYVNTYTGLCLCWLGVYFVSVFCVTIYLFSNQSYLDFLNMWALKDRPLPVFIGEIGVLVDSVNRNHAWYILWDYVRQTYDLDFAFWAFNGRKWFNERWDDEPFGLLRYDYSDWRNAPFVNQLFWKRP
jgi:hypothetical protein